MSTLNIGRPCPHCASLLVYKGEPADPKLSATCFVDKLGSTIVNPQYLGPKGETVPPVEEPVAVKPVPAVPFKPEHGETAWSPHGEQPQPGATAWAHTPSPGPSYPPGSSPGDPPYPAAQTPGTIEAPQGGVEPTLTPPNDWPVSG